MLLEHLDRLYKFADAFGGRMPEIRRVVAYLIHYGYLSGDILAAGTDLAAALVKLRNAIQEFQRLAGIADEGLSAATLIKMTEPRCGCADVQRLGVEQARWRKNRLTYCVQAFVGGISQADQLDLIRLAWADWQAAADLSLTPTSNQATADIVISTGRGQGQGFDGPSGTLAWAYLPNGQDGQLTMRFDFDERWTKDNPQAGILFRNVACHEFGHLLGLEHSRVSSALMAPFYSQGIVSPRQSDDIPRIQALYGPAKATPAPTPPTPAPGPNPQDLTIVIKMAGTEVKSVVTY